MKTTPKVSLLAAAALSVALASQARASFNYDLRLAPGQLGETDAHNATPEMPTTYTLQLWGQITGDTNLTNDGYVNGFVGIESIVSGGGGWTGGGGITSATLGANAQAAAGGPSVGASANITADGISDWGSASTGATAGWLKWVGGANPGFLDGTAQAGQSEEVNANTWEILLATFTVTTGVPTVVFDPQIPGTTTFQVVAPTGVKSGVSTLTGLIYTQDGSGNPTANGETSQGVTFSGVALPGPEPTSFGLLVLGGLTLITRRRRQHP